ncbi:MAG: FkbM family methyltransferase, partial [Planctomycetota bacterium]
MELKPYYRWAETFFPFSQSLKYRSFNFITRNFGKKVEPEFRALGRLGPVKLALDIGGNWGQSIEAFLWWCKPAQLISFEPNPRLSIYLSRHYRNNHSVEIMPFGLSDHEGSMELFIPKYRRFVFDALASTIETEARDWLNRSRMKFYDPEKLTINRETIDLRTLDSLNLEPDLVKIDVQGSEEAVVRG